MNIRVAICGLLCLFSACSVTSRPAATSTDLDTAIDEGTPVTSSAGSATHPNRPFSTSPFPTAGFSGPQNYAPDVLFAKDHGEFMVAREPWRPDLRASVLFLSDSEVKGEPGDFNLQHSQFDIERRIYPGHPDAFIDVGLQYGNREYDFSSGAGVASDETLHRASMTVTYGQFVDQDTLIEIDFNPGVWSDFSDSTLHHEDWQFYGRGLATWRFDKSVFVSAGVEYSGLFREFDVYPMLGVAYVIDPNWRVDVLLPRQARLTFSYSEHSSMFLSVDLDGGEYRIRAPSAAVGPSRTPRTVNVQEFTASLGGMHRINAMLSLEGRVGMTMGGDYRWLGNGPGDYDGQLEPQIFVEVGFGFSF